jgi:streptogramin lyase
MKQSGQWIFFCTALVSAFSASGAPQIQGRVLSLNGQAVKQAMVTLAATPGQPGPTDTTVFSDDQGNFLFPDSIASASAATPSAQALGYRMADAVSRKTATGLDITLIMRLDANEAGVAPASAWLRSIADPRDRTEVVQRCVNCHQMPAPEVRAFAELIHNVPNADPAAARGESWHAIAKYMNYLSAEEFGRGADIPVPVANGVYSAGDSEGAGKLLARTMTMPMQSVEGYQYNAPLLVNSRTVIREYEIPRPNAIREAITLDDPTQIWVADVNSNRIFRVDETSGAVRSYEIPSKHAIGPHTLRRAQDGSLWITPLFNAIVSRFDPKTEKWTLWPLDPVNGVPSGMHDITVDVNYDVQADKHGRLWYSDIVNNALGWLDPKTGKSGAYVIPPVTGRVGGEAVYGIVMSSDRIHVWYAQLGIGVFGSFNTETLKYETTVQMPDRNTGTRRICMSDQDVLYVTLYNTGQLAEYDTRKRKMIGVYDLPDRASAPYAVTWDAKRKVLWIPTSNSNLIYRFDPRDKSFAVLPLPREGSFLRMLAVDKHTGELITSYANIPEPVYGPRMAIAVDVGDDIYKPRRAATKNQEAAR